jgi:secreted trypsin-like serine protease
MPSKVINSTPVSVALYPFLLLLFAWDTKEHAWLTMCSSNAVGAHWAITAAHCTDNLDARMYMFSGVTNASCIWTSTPAKMYEDCGDVLEYIWAADEVHTHNKYDSITLKNDISLLYYKTPVHMSRYPRITNSTPPIGTNLTVLGYGRYQLGSFDLSDGLRKGIVFILDGRDYPGLGTILPGQLVAGNFADPNDPNDNEDTCQVMPFIFYSLFITTFE